MANLAESLIATIQKEHEAALKSGRQTIDHIVACGRSLLNAREMLPHGSFEPWVEQYFDFTSRTARRYITAAERYMALPADDRNEVTMTRLLNPPSEKRDVKSDSVSDLKSPSKADAKPSKKDMGGQEASSSFDDFEYDGPEPANHDDDCTICGGRGTCPNCEQKCPKA